MLWFLMYFISVFLEIRDKSIVGSTLNAFFVTEVRKLKGEMQK